MNQESQVRGDKYGGRAVLLGHRWERTAHIDYCHGHANVSVCRDCGASYHTYDERDPKRDIWAVVWMDDGDADDACERCAALKAGAEVQHTALFVPGRDAALAGKRA